jgi:hypothetical protein
MRNLEKKCVELLKEIKREHELSEQLLKEAFLHSEKVGELVIQLKEQLSPEEFEQWLQWNGVLERGEAEKCIKLSRGEKVNVVVKLEKEVKNE